MSSIRDNGFVPLTTASLSAKQNSDLKVTVVSQANHAQPFRPLGEAAPATTASAHAPSCEPRVTVQRDGDQVSAIHVHCSCGQIIELACVYGKS